MPRLTDQDIRQLSGTVVVFAGILLAFGFGLMFFFPPEGRFTRRDAQWSADCTGSPALTALAGAQEATARPIQPASLRALGPPTRDARLQAQEACYEAALNRLTATGILVAVALAILAPAITLYLRHHHETIGRT